MPIALSARATEESTYVVTAAFTDETGSGVIPDSITWTWTDDEGTVINARLDVAVAVPAISVDIVLSGADLALSAGEITRGVRAMTVKATYTSMGIAGLTLNKSLVLVVEALALVSWALSSVVDIKLFFGIAVTTYDALLQTLVNSASAFLEKATDRKLRARNYAYTNVAHREQTWYDGDGTSKLFTREYPINSVSYLEINGVELDAADGPGYTDYYGSTGYMIYSRRGELFYANGFAVGKQNVRISMNAGYAIGTPELEELRELCGALVSYVYANKSTLGFKSERIGNYAYSKGDLKAVEIYGVNGQQVIDRYRRKWGGQ